MTNPFYRDLRERFEDVYRAPLERGELTVVAESEFSEYSCVRVQSSSTTGGIQKVEQTAPLGTARQRGSGIFRFSQIPTFSAAFWKSPDKI